MEVKLTFGTKILSDEAQLEVLLVCRNQDIVISGPCFTFYDVISPLSLIMHSIQTVHQEWFN